MTVYESGLKIAHAAIVLLAATAPPVAAQPAPAPAPDAAAPRGELTATEVAGAPAPGEESGRIDVPDRDSAARRTARAVLYVPKVLVEIVLAPFQLPIWAYDRYHLRDLYYRTFYNEDRTIGLVPIATYETDFGFSVGARFLATDVAGENEQATVSAEFGGSYHQAFQGYMNSGDRLGDHVLLELYGEYQKRPRDIFYGIGNGDTTPRPPVPVDPYTTPVTLRTRFRQRIERIVGVINARLFDDLYLVSSNERGDRAYSPAHYGTPINEVFDTATLAGWPSTSYFYSELALRFDTRGRYNLFEPGPYLSVGTLAELWGGRNLRFNDNPDYWRYGLNLQHFIRLGEGPRVVALRFRGEGVSGSLTDVPFAQLPRLGGPRDLRGYTTDRFRDRVAAVGSAEYSWDLSYNVAAALFVDVGRVYSSIEDMTYHDLRCGFGLSLRFFSETSFWMDFTLASSVDGGVQVTASFDPVYLVRPRVRRR
ncbi:MAG TPA: BamA/TamA family outer membrane protein [Kofleriaceae bacterium]|jgi:outer membrane protein assembly factor BamA|nr:BamA/TamA family outer membrane protein [Kofleriaceae bacterium]